MRLLYITSKTYITILAIFIVLSVGFVVSASATKGSYPGSNGKIAFEAVEQGFDEEEEPADIEIFVMNEDGTGIQQLTFNDVDIHDVAPCWSPDGTKIAFSRAFFDVEYVGEIWIMNADGTGQRRLTTSPSGSEDQTPACSPDGTKIAFGRRHGTSGDTYLVNPDMPGSEIILIQDALLPSWSPDGTKIAFWRVYSGVYIADANTGTVLTQLTDDGVYPCWSPDGTQIVFIQSNEIWVMNADGSNQRLLKEALPGQFFEGSLNWSPDGNKIVYAVEEDSVWIMDSDGSNAFDLTPSMPNADGPDYQRIPLAPVGGVARPINKFAMLTPYLTLAGLITVVSTVYLIKKRKD